ncbi:RING-H2 zinc finger protein RHA1a [Morella rubra]|uniref:RING-H2 zinc finger protein RHA1a n=1 Tax=Morella rubra TaxID=262757 RepID=A0A6A1VAG7_9ROSI|nr:RING-H2 zinc finger protein RHA1a [Morella rubra]
MGFSAEEYSSGLLVTHLLYKIALVIAVVRWVLSWFLRRRDRIRSLPSVSSGSDEMAFSPSTAASTQMIRDSLIVTTFEDLTERLPETRSWDTCAVCLNQLSMDDEIRELRNCCHVFHRECIDRWVDRDHENHVTCPLCRTPLLTSSQFHSLSCGSGTQPSWAVERLLYLFGDDLYCN